MLMRTLKVYGATLAMAEVDGAPMLASGSDDGTVRLWDMRTGDNRLTIPIGSRVRSVMLWNDLLICGSKGGLLTIRL